ncbi:MAG: prefoldin subunit alpha [Thermoplasmata archaeon]|nr:MAG: prefoldin subunit alpha [Thermoplasmata archaeon]
MEESPDTYLAMIEMYREQMENIEMQSTYIKAIIDDYLKAKLTIENLEKREKGEILIPIGGGVFVPAKCEGVSKVLVSEGADVVIKKDLKGAKESLDRNINTLQENLKQLSEMHEKIRDRIGELSEKVRELIEERKG